MSHFKLIIISLFVLALAGCTSQTLPDPDASDTTYGDSGSGADTDGYDSDGLDGGEFIDYDPSGGELGNILYFEFDSSELRAEDTDTVSRHARQLAENASLRVRLEGHADERGSREYNIALADRRAQSVKRLLTFQGASSSQIIVISYGEEKPAALGHDESAWQLNRRAELIYGE